MTEQWSFSTKDEITQNNIKVTELMVRANQFTNTVDDYKTIFNEAMNINPNNTSVPHADHLNNLKYDLYQKINYIENQENRNNQENQSEDII